MTAWMIAVIVLGMVACFFTGFAYGRAWQRQETAKMARLWTEVENCKEDGT